MFEDKLLTLQKWLLNQNIDLAYVSDPAHIAYFTGYHSNPHERVLALLVFAAADPFLFTPALETDEAQHSAWKFDVIGYLDNEDPWQKIAEAIRQRVRQPQKIGLEKEDISLARYEAFTAYFPAADYSVNITEFIQQQQLCKSSAELAFLKEAGEWADQALQIGFSLLKEGITEQEVVAEIEYKLKRAGVKAMSFDTLVLFGDHAASPHGIPGRRRLQKGELVLFDLGVVWKGYCSDVSRTVAFHSVSAFQQEIYQLVLTAQQTSQAAVKPGITAGELDAIARNIITKAGYGTAFNHRLGHGIGTTVHEYPSLTAENPLNLQPGMCFSIEPGIYLPEQLGVRIEDCVSVTETGAIPLTTIPKELTIINND